VSCAESKIAIVTDIDETLTTSDAQFAMQLSDAAYDPLARAAGPELMQGYAEHGFFILYLTARPEPWTLQPTGETAHAATDRWLTEHGFPRTRSELVLAPDVVVGDATRQYKAGALQQHQASGYEFRYAYGNAQTDIDAYADAGIDKLQTYTIGVLAGGGGTVAIAGEDFTQHAAEQLPKLSTVCR